MSLIKKRKMLVDQKCVDLAEHFLSDTPTLNTPENRQSMAEDIQYACEDWYLGKVLNNVDDPR